MAHTSTTASHFKSVSASRRPATGGKNISTGARRQSASAQVPTGRTAPIKGPDRGEG